MNLSIGLSKTIQVNKEPQQNWIRNAAGMHDQRLKGTDMAGNSQDSRDSSSGVFTGSINL